MTKLNNAVMMIRAEAIRLAKNEVKAEIRAHGFRLHSFTNAEIQLAAKEWFASHRRELVERALATILRWRLEEAFRKVQLAERERNAQSNGASAFRKSEVHKCDG
jgi:hypothetical protein